MQAKDTHSSSTEDIPTAGGSVKTLKSFDGLKEATTERDIDKFAELVRKGIDTWRTAGQVLVQLAAVTPDIVKRITDRYPHISESTLDTFLRIGRNEIWPPLLMDSSYGAKRLLECNYDIQKEYAQKSIQVATSWTNGEIKSVTRKVSDLSRSEAMIVFDARGGINNLEQQAFRLPGSFRSASLCPAVPVAPPIKYTPPKTVNVNIGYFNMTVRGNSVIYEPCGKSAMAQPVRVIKNNVTGELSAVVVFYKTETK